MINLYVYMCECGGGGGGLQVGEDKIYLSIDYFVNAVFHVLFFSSESVSFFFISQTCTYATPPTCHCMRITCVRIIIDVFLPYFYICTNVYLIYDLTMLVSLLLNSYWSE